jgi:SNF2 family DNA or RNA helicase
MIFKEVSVQGDEGALLPHWITVKSRQSCLGEEEAGGDYKRRKIDEANSDIFYMDTFTGTLSQVRMVCRQSEPGGCLCDEMGLGKSLSASVI